MKKNLKVFFMGGSLARKSLNHQFAMTAAVAAKKIDGVEVVTAHFKDFNIPVFDGDLAEHSPETEGVKRLNAVLQDCDAWVISVPEFNGSIPGGLKNAIDWLSTHTPHPFRGKHVLLLAASPGALGGVRGLWHSRVPFEALFANVYPEMFGLPKAHVELAQEGKLADPKSQERLENLLGAFIAHARRD